MILKRSQNGILYPYATFRMVMFDVSGQDPESFGPNKQPSKGLVLDETYHNQVTQIGLNGYAKIANSESGFTGVVNYCALGTDANAPSILDTLLGAEIGRTGIVVGTNIRTNNAIAKQFYFGPTEANGNIKEVGGFIDATATANSGTLFDRSLLDIVKTNLNALYIYFTQTFSA